ncbi:nuclear transport factor 2 family protein [Pseudonocardia asaccharolytica]|uniref:SnoaL-like domain-containing protein n=1 Tax=Pseudonocardia asaccharolytica DSM 44247 = NBRC 16224 TaxID=1123024 RepID=A0A511D7J2_9PSEU|nr:nuclear transport factor 2 family protein [Pseudonocardia asaccharolytica]GEL20779.1 hypothetical protein PA7_46160 [Pseudonocardia asaccharolytica DSM 44247 = NBRC 16224]
MLARPGRAQLGLAGTGAEAIRHVKDAIRDVHAAIPDLTFTIEDTVEAGDTIWVRVPVRGTLTVGAEGHGPLRADGAR